MPLVRISLMEGKNADYRRKIGDVVHQAMVDTINCPPQDRFQLISEHPGDISSTRRCLWISRTPRPRHDPDHPERRPHGRSEEGAVQGHR